MAWSGRRRPPTVDHDRVARRPGRAGASVDMSSQPTTDSPGTRRRPPVRLARVSRRRLPTVSPSLSHRLDVVALVLTALIVLTGAAVRLTGSGLGCADWPECSVGHLTPALQFHGLVEFGNRLVTVVLTVAVVAALLGSVFRAPRRRDLIWLSGGLVAGVVAQAVLGGIVVYTKLNPYLVMVHFYPHHAPARRRGGAGPPLHPRLRARFGAPAGAATADPSLLRGPHDPGRRRRRRHRHHRRRDAMRRRLRSAGGQAHPHRTAGHGGAPLEPRPPPYRRHHRTRRRPTWATPERCAAPPASSWR